jgi:4-hydroxybenzoyl-CoA reductase subunit alpha
VANAIGIDFDQLPLTPDRVVQAMIERRRKVRASALIGHSP